MTHHQIAAISLGGVAFALAAVMITTFAASELPPPPSPPQLPLPPPPNSIPSEIPPLPSMGFLEVSPHLPPSGKFLLPTTSTMVLIINPLMELYGPLQISDSSSPFTFKTAYRTYEESPMPYFHSYNVNENFFWHSNKDLASIFIQIKEAANEKIIQEHMIDDVSEIDQNVLPINRDAWFPALFRPSTRYRSIVTARSRSGETVVVEDEFITRAVEFKEGPVSLITKISSKTVRPGDIVTVQWASSNADWCKWEDRTSFFDTSPSSGAYAGRVALSGSKTYRASRDSKMQAIDVRVTCGNYSHVKEYNANIPIIHFPDVPSPIITFSVSSNSLKRGKSATLRWSLKNTETCFTQKYEYVKDHWDYAQEPSWTWGNLTYYGKTITDARGNVSVSPMFTSRYSLICKNKHQYAQKSILIVINDVLPGEKPPPLGSRGSYEEEYVVDPRLPRPDISFSFDPQIVKMGGLPVRVSWKTEHAKQCSMSANTLPVKTTKKTHAKLKKLSAKDLPIIMDYLDKKYTFKTATSDYDPDVRTIIEQFEGPGGHTPLIGIEKKLNAYLGIDKDSDYDDDDPFEIDPLTQNNIPLKGSTIAYPRTSIIYTIQCEGRRTADFVDRSAIVIVEQPQKQK